MAALVALAVGCSNSDGAGDDDRGDGDSGDENIGQVVDCAGACADQMDACGPPPSGDPCGTVCAVLDTSAEVSCLEASTCDELADAFDVGEVPCQGGGSGGGDCDPSDPPYCDGNEVISCELIGGAPGISTETCSSGETCEDGACVADAQCLPLDSLDCNPGECCEGTVCSGEGGGTRCCVQVQSDDACANDSDCCGHDPEAQFTSRCIAGTCEPLS